MSDKRQRTHQVGVRLTPDEYWSLVERAVAGGTSIPEVLRRAALSRPFNSATTCTRCGHLYSERACGATHARIALGRIFIEGRPV